MNDLIRVLYVDDNPLDRDLVRHALEVEHSEFDLTITASRADFEAALAKGSFDLVLSDFNILGYDGLQVIQLVHAKDPTLPVVVVTGTGTEETAVEAMQLGAADYVIKTPDHIKRLPLTLHAVLDKQKAELALHESEERYRLLFLNSREAILLTNPDGTIHSANPEACRMFGRTEQEFKLLKRAEIMDPNDPRLPSALEERARTGSFKGELNLVRNGGTIFPAELTATIFKDSDGEERTSMFIRDISERRLAEEIIQEAQTKYRTLVEQIPNAITYIDSADPAVGTLYISPQIEELLGYTPEEWQANPTMWHDLIHPDDRKTILALDMLHDKTGETLSRDYRLLAKNGDTIWISDTATMLYDMVGNPLYSHGIMIDISERKQAEQALFDVQERVRGIIDTAMDAIISIDDSQRIILFNPAAEAMFRCKQADALGQPIERFLPERFRAGHFHHIRKFSETGMTSRSMGHSETVYGLRSNGEEFPVEASISQTRTSGNTLYTVILRDVTERKQAETERQAIFEIMSGMAKAKDLREFLALIHASIAKVIYAKNFFVVFYNHETGLFEEIYSVDEYDPPMPPSKLEKTITAYVFRTGEAMLMPQHVFDELAAKGEVTLIGANSVSWLGAPLITANGKLGVIAVQDYENPDRYTEQDKEFLASIGSQVSIALERKRAEDEVKKLKEFNETLIDHMGEGIIVQNAEGYFSFLNPAALEITGYLPEELIGRHWTRFISVNQQDIVHDADARRIAGESSRYEVNFLHKNGRWINLLVSGSPIFENGQFNGTIAVFVDISERKRAEQIISEHAEELEQRVQERTMELNQTNIELEYASRAKDEFLATMSHELRTPLNSILGFSENLLEKNRGPLNEKQEQYVGLIHSSGQHLLSLINDILQVSKIEAGKLDIHPDTVSVKDVCESSLNFIREAALKKSISLEYTYEPSIPTVQADPQRLKQIVVNLLSNAVKFTPQNGRVSLAVRTNAEEDRIYFSVSDNGIGISHEDLEKLFTPFTQLDSNLSRQYEGTGLGLVIVYKLAELHGGSVEVESAPGVGSRFTVILPWRRNETDLNGNVSSHIETTEPSPTLSGGQVRILLAEDNESNILTIQEYLSAHGYKVIVAHNGLEAIDMAEKFSPKILLMDIQMPKMDGLEAIRRLRADPKFASVPIIALTALAMPGDRERCLEAGANDYMSKPVQFKTLVKIIQKLLEAQE